QTPARRSSQAAGSRAGDVGRRDNRDLMRRIFTATRRRWDHHRKGMSTEDRTRWDARYQAAAPARRPAAFLTALEGELPRSGRALDVAGGAGRNALWLARRGLEVTLVDIAPSALALARAAA